MRNKLKSTLKSKGEKFGFYVAKKTYIDPNRGDYSTDDLNPTYIQVLVVNHLDPQQRYWRMGGEYDQEAIVFIIEAHYRALIEKTAKIKQVSTGNEYYGYLDTVGSKFRIKPIDSDYIQVYTTQKV